jgi:formate hydrogenlyase subunit 6/NADH:ubiquinone oxidoreductase subunit I
MSGSLDKYPGLNPLPPPFVRELPPIAQVVEPKCIGCDRCPPLCFFDALVMDVRPDHPHGRVAVVIAPNCTGCGLCFESCPVDAIIWVPGERQPGESLPRRSHGKEAVDEGY